MSHDSRDKMYHEEPLEKVPQTMPKMKQGNRPLVYTGANEISELFTLDVARTYRNNLAKDDALIFHTKVTKDGYLYVLVKIKQVAKAHRGARRDTIEAGSAISNYKIGELCEGRAVVSIKIKRVTLDWMSKKNLTLAFEYTLAPNKDENE